MIMFPNMPTFLLITLFSLDILFMLVAFANYLIIYCGHYNNFQSLSGNADFP